MNVVEFLVNHNAHSRNNSFPRIKPQRPSGEVQNPRPLSVRRKSVQWRGHGGRHPTVSSVQFDRQLDKVSIWLEQWSHETRCSVLEALLRQSNYTQFQFLYTVMQPSLHRDFKYTANSRFPDIEFKPISTHISRELKDKLSRLRLDTFYREKSVYLQTEERTHVQLPSSNCSSECDESLRHKNESKPKTKSKHRLSKSSVFGSNSQLSVGSDLLYSDQINTCRSEPPICDAVFRFIEMPVRRHIQDENSPGQVQPDLTTRPHPAQNATRSSHKHSRKKTKGAVQIKGPELREEGRLLIKWYTESWTDTKKNEFLHKLLLKLDQRQHYFISSFLSERQHRDFITLLPESLSLKILSYLSPRDLVLASQVSKSWQKLTNHNNLWEAKCRQVKIEVPVSDSPIWKRVFRDNLYLRLNWNNGVCRVLDLKGHTQSVLTVTFDKERLASGSADKTVRVWDIKTGQLLHTLRGHTKGVWCLEFFTQHLLISGSYDSTIRVWNLRLGSTSRILLGHSGPVWAFVLRGNLLVSGSQDKMAKVWDINRSLLLHTLAGHNAAIFSVDMNEAGSLAITGSADRSVRLWSTETGVCKKVVWISQTTSIMAVSYSQGYFACSFGATICLYKGTQLVKTFNEHYKRIEALELRIVNADTGEGMIVSGGKDGLVKYWDITKDASIQTFVGQSENINCIHFDELRIASGSQDNKIRLWDFNI